MALPCGFEGPSQYFEEFLNFIQKYEYLFNFPNTDVLVNNALDNIKVDTTEIDVFREEFDISTVTSGYVKKFFKHLDKLDVRYDQFKDDENLQFLIDVPLSIKKKHEIGYLAKEIENICNTIQCDTIVDFGSGLGYLDEQLFKTTDYNVLGLECKETHYVGAKKRQRKYYPDSINRVKYIKHTINPESYVNIKEYLNDKFPNSSNFCIAGLHACADLTVEAVDIFLKMENARAMIVLPCCYHKLTAENNVDVQFKNFPLSNALKDIYKQKSFKCLSVPFLRLATQPPKVKNENLDDKVFNLLARAVLQLYAFKHNYKLKRNKRKAVRLKTLKNNFEDYAADAVKGFKLLHKKLDGTTDFYEDISNMGILEVNIEELLTIWRQISEVTYKKAAIFVLLQNKMQPVFENFVLFDRLVYLQENGIKTCQYKNIINEKISPRCLALIAQK